MGYHRRPLPFVELFWGQLLFIETEKGYPSNSSHAHLSENENISQTDKRTRTTHAIQLEKQMDEHLLTTLMMVYKANNQKTKNKVRKRLYTVEELLYGKKLNSIDCTE